MPTGNTGSGKIIKGYVDSLCLQEIQTSGDIVKQRLKTVHPKCFASTLPTTKELGAAIGVNPKIQIKEILFNDLSSPNWIGVRVGDTSPYTVISVYAGGTSQELGKVKGLVIISGDFTMVESLDDRWEGKGLVIKGGEMDQWECLKSKLDFTDVGSVGEFTWQNYSAPPLATKTRLHRTYVTQALANSFLRATASPYYNTCASNHYPPVVTKLDDKATKVRSNWFHIDPTLFKLPCVQEAMSHIWEWNHKDPPAPQWSRAVKHTQLFLIQIKKGVTAIRKKRQEEIYTKLSLLESKTHTLNKEEVKEIAEMRSQIKTAEEIQPKQLQAYLKGWWKEREDQPVKKICRTLKRRQDQELLPLLVKKDGSLAGS